MNKATTTTFSVSDLVTAATPLQEVPYKEAVEALLKTAAPDRLSRSVEAIEEFTSKVEEHIGSEFDLFQPTFTTTGPVERAAAGVVLLDAIQSYFTYDLETLCGIPAITLEGTPEDWQAVADRAEQFGSLNLEWWLEPLQAIVHQFVAAARGVVDRPFWQSLCKFQDESGGPVITGWISALFPYLKDGRTGLATFVPHIRG